MRETCTASNAAAELVQDAGWPGYEEVPGWIVDGYSTLFAEVDEQLADAGAAGPGLVAIPAGVGSLAQAWERVDWYAWRWPVAGRRWQRR